MSKFKFIVCDRDYNEVVIESAQADEIYQTWVDTHPNWCHPNGEPDCATLEGDALMSDHWSTLIDIGQAVFGPEFLVQTHIEISVN